MCFNSGNCRDAYYCEDSRTMTNATDCAFCENCELAYECVDCDACYNSNFCQDCTNCQDVNFSYDLRRCKNCHQCFDTRHTEDSGYIYQANLDMGTKDSWDCGPIPTGMDLCYDVGYAHFLFNSKHLYWCGNLKDCEYCINCLESEHLFGCNYMQKKQKAFYILNEKVGEDFYWKTTEKFKKEILENGLYTLHDLVHKDLELGAKHEKMRKELGDKRERECFICGDGFEIVPVEIEFYKKMKIIWPVYCPNCRAKQRYEMRTERKMHKRKCDSCKKTLITTFPPDSPYIVYCLPCYWKNIG